ncbi:MAG: helix-turn-helix domain-containing protein [archaeon]
MWICSFKLRHGDCILGSRAKSFNCSIYTYLISHNATKSDVLYTFCCVISGSQKDKQNLIADLRKDKRIFKLEIDSDYVFLTYKEKLDKLFYTVVFNPLFFYLKPMVIDNYGWENYEIASWTKKPLMDLLKVSKKEFEFKLNKLIKSKNKEIFIPHIFPRLTDSQKKAFELAVKNGYYEVPKKIDLKELGRLMNISRQTYQQHLKTAEKKIMPSLLDTVR